MTVRSGQLDWLLVEFVRDTPGVVHAIVVSGDCLLYTSPSPRDLSTSRMPSSA